MLPEGWVAAVAVGFKAARMGVPGLQARLQLQTGRSGAAGERRLSAVAEMDATLDLSHMRQMKQVADQETERFDRLCEACGKQAVGLRACARCRTVRYCSRKCQAAHWSQHKRECRPA